MLVVTLTVTADEYIDPQTNVVYTYEPGKNTASVKAGYEEVIDMCPNCELDIVYYPGSPDAAGDVVILDRFTVGTTEYVVTSIGRAAFRENNNIKSVSIPETVTEIGPSAFSFCDNLAIVQLPKNLTRIASNLFQGCSQLVSVNIPSSVLTIENWAFYGCSSLSSITLPSGLITVGRNVFNGTPWYAAQYDKAPDGPFYIGTQLFGYKGDKPTGELVIKEGTTCIGFEAFLNCGGLNSVTFPQSVVYVDQDAFANCTGLKAVHITDLAAWCGIDFQYAFQGSSNPLTYAHHLYLNGEEVTDLVIPESVTSIGDYTFDNCTALTSITIPDGVTSIGTCAFRSCENLTSVTIPPSLATIGGGAFIWCFNLGAVYISDLAAWCSITFIENAVNPLCYGAHLYLNGEEVIDLVIPEGVTNISNYVFQNYSHLTSVTIPDGVTTIGEYAFNGCSGLTSITIGNNVNSIGQWAFGRCEKLKDVYCYAESVPESINTTFFNETNIEEATLHVPAASVSAYQAVEPWKNFKEIVALTNNPETPKYFPTGMTWEEIVVNPGMELENDNACIYEIGTDTIIGDVTYKKVLKNNVFSGLCVRESGDKVWLLTKEYPTEILLYNFDWDSNQEIVTEYLKGQDENDKVYEVRQETTPVGDSQAVEIEGKTYQYIMKRLSGTLIRGIGKVAELNRYPCLLSYREPYQITPGLDYHKVHWIKRNGVEIFRSESAKEWTEEIKDDYRPFIEDGKVWKVGNCQAILDNSVRVVDYYYFEGDTIIDGKTCKQMMCQRFVSSGFSDEYGYWTPQPFLRKMGAWYEEDKKVYFYDEIIQSMKMMYDFSLGDYETVGFLNVDGYPPYIIGPRQTGGIKGFKGVYRDIMMGQDINTKTPWLEGVGGLDGPFASVYHPLADNKPEFLMSCSVGDEVIYLNDEVEDGATPGEAAEARKNRFDFTHTIKTQPKAPSRRSEEISLYGEYSNRQLDINLDPLDDTYLVRITDESGEVVYEKSINAGTIVGLSIDISAYAKGRYTVTVENSRESFTGEFNAQETGIYAITNKKVGIRHYIYNLHGQRLSSLQKGLNIVDGQKIFVK